jgi:hypothetical protein
MNRIVLRLMCDERGEISFLFGPWGAVDRAEAIRQIESGERGYTLQRADGSLAPLVAVGDGDEKRLSAFEHGAEVSLLESATRIGA